MMLMPIDYQTLKKINLNKYITNLNNNNMTPIQTSRQKCIVYSRVVGWITPVQNFNPGKTSEYADRLTYETEEKAC